MGPITTVTKFVEIEKSRAAQNPQLLFQWFELTQQDALRSPAKLPADLCDNHAMQVHRLSVRTYHFSASSDKNQVTR